MAALEPRPDLVEEPAHPVLVREVAHRAEEHRGPTVAAGKLGARAEVRQVHRVGHDGGAEGGEEGVRPAGVVLGGERHPVGRAPRRDLLAADLPPVRRVVQAAEEAIARFERLPREVVLDVVLVEEHLRRAAARCGAAEIVPAEERRLEAHHVEPAAGEQRLERALHRRDGEEGRLEAARRQERAQLQDPLRRPALGPRGHEHDLVAVSAHRLLRAAGVVLAAEERRRADAVASRERPHQALDAALRAELRRARREQRDEQDVEPLGHGALAQVRLHATRSPPCRGTPATARGVLPGVSHGRGSRAGSRPARRSAGR